MTKGGNRVWIGGRPMKELPVLPDLTLMWADINAWHESKTPYPKPTAAINETVIAMLQAYGQQCAAHARGMALGDAVQACKDEISDWHLRTQGYEAAQCCVERIEALKLKGK